MIDTAEKRRAVGGIAFFIFLGVTPNVTKDIEWRQEAGWGYPGITPAGGTPLVVGGMNPYIDLYRRIPRR